jgi:hypothetical protein
MPRLALQGLQVVRSIGVPLMVLDCASMLRQLLKPPEQPKRGPLLPGMSACSHGAGSTCTSVTSALAVDVIPDGVQRHPAEPGGCGPGGRAPPAPPADSPSRCGRAAHGSGPITVLQLCHTCMSTLDLRASKLKAGCRAVQGDGDAADSPVTPVTPSRFLGGLSELPPRGSFRRSRHCFPDAWSRAADLPVP